MPTPSKRRVPSQGRKRKVRYAVVGLGWFAQTAVLRPTMKQVIRRPPVPRAPEVVRAESP